MAYNTMSEADVKAAASRVGSEASKALTDAGEKAGEMVSNAKQLANDQFDKVETAIRRNPIAAASIAGGIGFFLAVLARR